MKRGTTGEGLYEIYIYIFINLHITILEPPLFFQPRDECMERGLVVYMYVCMYVCV